MKKSLLILFIAVFFLGCVTPVVGLALAGPAPAAANEAAVAMPKLLSYDGSLNTEYLSNWDDYLSKSFFPRLRCITLWDKLCSGVFGTSVNDDVVLGRDGWLFYFTAADDRAGASLLSDAEIAACAHNAALMQEYVESRGGRFLLTVPNAKYDLYPDHVRDYVKIAEGRNVELLQDALQSEGVSFCDMYSLFSKEDEILYWHTDSHWNGRGAALAADGILTGLGREAHWFGGEFVEAEPHLGDLYEMLYPKGELREPDWLPASGFRFEYVSRFGTVNDVEIETASETGEGRLLLFRDSFGRNLYPYLAEDFAAAQFSRENSYDLCRMESMGATDVVVELGQRNIVYLLRYAAVYPAPERDASVTESCALADCAVQSKSAERAMPGYVLLTGELDGVDGTPVYVRLGGRIFEAMRTETGFAAYVPADADVSAAEVLIGQ